jgi:hypothetical protein
MHPNYGIIVGLNENVLSSPQASIDVRGAAKESVTVFNG